MDQVSAYDQKPVQDAAPGIDLIYMDSQTRSCLRCIYRAALIKLIEAGEKGLIKYEDQDTADPGDDGRRGGADLVSQRSYQ